MIVVDTYDGDNIILLLPDISQIKMDIYQWIKEDLKEKNE